MITAPPRTLFYRNNCQFVGDVEKWCRDLPNDFVCVVGVKQSGVLPAAVIANRFNIHLATSDEIVAGHRPWRNSNRRRHGRLDGGGVLLVDDSVATGETMRAVREAVAAALPAAVRVETGAVYVMSQGRGSCQHYYKDVGRTDHVFQYNVMHHWFIEDSYVDMDGLLCEDWPYPYEDRDKVDAYQDFLHHARPLIIPTFPIGRIVTGRLERHRAVTEEWLARHGVRFHALTMHPDCDPRDRDSVKLKSEAFRHSHAMMFIESCGYQARRIASTTSRPVLSWEEQRLYNGAEV